MQKQSLRVVSRLTILVTLLAVFGTVAARADYYSDLFACSDAYYPVLDECRGRPFYPYDPTEGLCRYEAGGAYVGCLNGLSEPAPEMDFCAMAEWAHSGCLGNWGFFTGAVPDSGTYWACREASLIDQCM